MFEPTRRDPLLTVVLVLALIVLVPAALGVILTLGPIALVIGIVLIGLVVAGWAALAIGGAVMSLGARSLRDWITRAPTTSAREWERARVARDARVAKARRRADARRQAQAAAATPAENSEAP